MKIGFLGPKGTFSHEALNEYNRSTGIGDCCIPCSFNSIPDILTAVQIGDIDEAIVPIENSLEGAVNATMDMLATDIDLLIKAEFVIPIRANLLVRKGMAMTEIRYILSHPQPLGQCRSYIHTNFPQAEVVSAYSTAGAAEQVAKGEIAAAAIGTLAAAEAYGLEVVAHNIQDGDNNMTRFVVISAEGSLRSGCDKTSIVFSTENQPGSLYKILDIFSLWDINMTRIESRPAKNQLGRYIFFIDIEGHCEDADVRDALVMVKRKTSFYKFLGSYPSYKD